MTPAANNILDQTAIGLSLLCLVHCLALPLALALLPSLAILPLADEHFHLWLIVLVIPTSIVALGVGCRRHRHWQVLFWGITGVIMLVLAAVLAHEGGNLPERMMTVVGALTVALGHALNYKHCRDIECTH